MKIIMFLALLMPQSGYRDLPAHILVHFHLTISQLFTGTKIAESTAWEAERLIRTLGKHLTSSQRQWIAERCGTILAKPNSDRVKITIVWLVRELGPDGRLALDGLRTYLAEVVASGPDTPKGTTPTLRMRGGPHKEEFLRSLITRLER